jgi:hypothetical protein
LRRDALSLRGLLRRSRALDAVPLAAAVAVFEVGERDDEGASRVFSESCAAKWPSIRVSAVV